MYLLNSSDIHRWLLTIGHSKSLDRNTLAFVFTDHRQHSRLEQLASHLRSMDFDCEPVKFDGDGEAYITLHPTAVLDEAALLAANSNFRAMAGNFRVKYLGIEVADLHKHRNAQPVSQVARTAQINRTARTSSCKTSAVRPVTSPCSYKTTRQTDQKFHPLSLLPLAVGGVCIVMFGIWLLAGHATLKKEIEAHKSWIQTEGLLQEVGIRYNGTTATRFEMLVRYTFKAGDREFKGEWLDSRHWSRLLHGVQILAAEFTPEAANLKDDDFSFLGQTTKFWQMPFPGTPVQVRYDPANPRRAELILKNNPLRDEPAPSYLIWGIGIFIILLGLFPIALYVLDFFKKGKRPLSG